MKKSLTVGVASALVGAMVLAGGGVNASVFADKSEQFVTLSEGEVRFLPVLPGEKSKVKAEGLQKHSKGLKLVENFFIKNKIQVIHDLDDPKFQMAAKKVGTAFDSFTDEEMQSIVELTKFIDMYENFDANEKIKGFKEKVKKNGKLTRAEYEQLNSIMPINPLSAKTREGGESIQTESVERIGVEANGYDRFAARDYARDWTSNEEILRNNSVFGYYSAYNDGCYDCWNDCANLVSQALYTGGMKFYYGLNYQSPSSWSYSDIKPSYSWGAAHDFKLHWSGRAGVAPSETDLQTGDAVNADFEGDGHIDHTAIITYTGSERYLTQHSVDREEETHLGDWFDSNYTVYGYEMDLADN